MQTIVSLSLHCLIGKDVEKDIRRVETIYLFCLR